jgi:phage terminase small subunit
MPRLTNRRHERFAQEYISNGCNQSKAARAVGVAVASAAQAGSEWLRNPKILARIMEINDRVLENLVMSRDEVLAEMNHLASYNTKDLYDDDGQMVSIHELPEALTAAIKEIEHDALGRPSKIKFVDKRGALNDMMKYYNLFEDHQQAGVGEMTVVIDGKDSKA